MIVSQNAIALLTSFEGLRLFTYGDAAGNKTIGIGHKITKEELESGTIIISNVSVKWATGLAYKSMAVELLHQDVTWAEQCVSKNIATALNQNQFDALVCFVYNVGGTAFADSHLRQVINDDAGENIETEEWARWIHVDGKVCPGLMRRRASEIDLWQKAV